MSSTNTAGNGTKITWMTFRVCLTAPIEVIGWIHDLPPIVISDAMRLNEGITHIKQNYAYAKDLTPMVEAIDALWKTYDSDVQEFLNIYLSGVKMGRNTARVLMPFGKPQGGSITHPSLIQQALAAYCQDQKLFPKLHLYHKVKAVEWY